MVDIKIVKNCLRCNAELQEGEETYCAVCLETKATCDPGMNGAAAPTEPTPDVVEPPVEVDDILMVIHMDPETMLVSIETTSEYGRYPAKVVGILHEIIANITARMAATTTLTMLNDIALRSQMAHAPQGDIKNKLKFRGKGTKH